MTEPKRLVNELKKIEKIVEKKEKELEYLNYIKYYHIFESAIVFLKNKRVILYGGVALNEILPPRLKFYDKNSLPDLDMMSPDARKIASELVYYYKKTKHQAVSFTEALHKGTYKVFADGIQVIDITQCAETTYRKLRTHSSISSLGLMIAPLEYIRMTLHQMLSLPNDATNRWEKVFKRLFLFYKAYPIEKCKIPHEIVSQPFQEHVENLYKILKDSDCIFFGIDELSIILQKPLGFYYNVPPIQVIVNSEIDILVKNIIYLLPDVDQPIFFTADDFVSNHVIISLHGQPLLCIHEAQQCHSFTIFRKRRIASMHTIITILLSMCLSPYRHFYKMRLYFKCIVNELSIVQQNFGKNYNTSIVRENLPLYCMGPTSGLATLRRNRILRLKKKLVVHND